MQNEIVLQMLYKNLIIMAFNTPRGQRKEPLLSSLAKRLNFFDWLSEKLNLNKEFPVSMLKKVLFAFGLVIIYIFFQHNIESLTRGLTKAETEIKEKRASYISHKSAYMFESKHSQVSEALAERGLHRNIEPPVKITVEH